MFLVTSSEMEKIEQAAVKELTLTLYDLMEKAGLAVAEEAIKMSRGKPVVIVCGRGNNGGDGLVAARHLIQKKVPTTVFLLAPPTNFPPEAAKAYSALKELSSGLIFELEKDKALFQDQLSSAGLIVDGIFGLGFKGAIQGELADVVELINQVSAKRLAIDIPSGVEADSGGAGGVCIKADKTVTFTCPKVGLVCFPGADLAGKVVVREVGIPSSVVEKHTTVRLASACEVKELLPSRSPDAHKKACGRVLVVAGSVGMTGAAVMTAESALKGGAGLVTLGLPASLNPIAEVKLTEVMTFPLPETAKRTLSEKAFDLILPKAESFDVLVVGPGLSTHESITALVRQLIASISLPLVIDADGLNTLVGGTSILANLSQPVVITPHPGELARLFGTTTEKIQADRLGWARKASQEWKVTVVLKGARSVVASEEGLTVIPTGNAGMATAGAGDILTGLVGSFMAQGVDAYPASILSSYLHGLAGDLAARELTEYCLTATNLIEYLPSAIKQLKETKKGLEY